MGICAIQCESPIQCTSNVSCHLMYIQREFGWLVHTEYIGLFVCLSCMCGCQALTTELERPGTGRREDEDDEADEAGEEEEGDEGKAMECTYGTS